MKRLLLLIPLLTMMVACDAPQRTRAPSNFITGNNFQNSPGYTTNPSPGTTTGGTNTGGTTTPPATGTTTPGFESCDLTYKYHTGDIGWFGLCQSSKDETHFKFRPSTSSTSIRVCLIPTYRDASGASTFVGNPQCTYTTANQVVEGRLYKDRTGFTNYPINGVIVMKEPLIPEYVNCMLGYVNWPGNACASLSALQCNQLTAACPYGGRTGGACDTQARTYMANLCNTFKARYPNSYADIATK